MRRRHLKKLLQHGHRDDVHAWICQAATSGSKKHRRRAKCYGRIMRAWAQKSGRPDGWTVANQLRVNAFCRDLDRMNARMAQAFGKGATSGSWDGATETLGQLARAAHALGHRLKVSSQ